MTQQPQETRISFVTVLSLLTGAAALWSGLLLLTRLDRLPNPLAVHWGVSGLPDGSLSTTGLLAVAAAFFLLPTALVFVGRRRPQARADVLAGGAAVAALGAALVWSVSTLNLDAPHWTEARPMSLLHVIGLLSAPLLTGAAGAQVGRRLWPKRSGAPDTSPATSLEPGERAMWMGQAGNRALGYAAWAPVALVLGSALASGRAALLLSPLLFLVPVLEAFSLVRVTVDSTGLTIRYGHLGWLRQHIALDEIESARATELEPLVHGGWGYRGSVKLLGRAFVIVRKGPGIVLTLAGEKEFGVTASDANSGAELLNGLLHAR